MKKAILFKTIGDAKRSAKAAGYHISDGNKKLIPNEKTGFIVWNLPAVMTCPYATKIVSNSVTHVRRRKHIPIASRPVWIILTGPATLTRLLNL